MERPRDKMHDIDGRLFQARMWRDYARQWGSPWARPWCQQILRVSREECIRRARINLYLARRLNRRKR